ncbi:rhodanese-like domain-containing protein [Verrucomicrobiaceae bacterium 5K15]|uniref:Rhodanese-like domain-containing protein n=1 Tax=Oceaniferula flava TaxID=2800421 RepID=A0AAE2SFQ4_9BACT|nr:rhodanese-like domain-containing protein [Oceaniferula flavus]MBK1856044.1 rhodanese-like domain-containing protein [Oceaniferula flavus]MBM1137351.1 rhodanese-like domain-containing protein [Oceaniferula flavus]
MKLNTLLLASAACMAVAAPMDLAYAQGATKDKKEKKAKHKASFPNMTVKEVQQAIEDGKVTIIDVNSPKSYQSGHVPGAIHWAAVKSKLAEALPEDKSALILAYCSGPN